MMLFPPVFEYHSSYHGANLLLGAVLAVVVMIVLAVTLAFFVLKAYALYRIAARRGIHKPWLSWIPVGQDWIRGSISDQYRYLHSGRIQHRRVILAIASAVYLLTCALGIGSLLHHIVLASVGMMGHGRPDYVGYHMARIIMTGGGLGFLTACAWIVRTVFHHLCMYDLYASSDPKNDGAMTLLGILIPILEPIFLFCVREKDDGMPPRKGGPRQAPPQDGPRDDGPVDPHYDSPDDGPAAGPTQL